MNIADEINHRETTDAELTLDGIVAAERGLETRAELVERSR
jgi:hypothetical protein